MATYALTGLFFSIGITTAISFLVIALGSGMGLDSVLVKVCIAPDWCDIPRWCLCAEGNSFLLYHGRSAFLRRLPVDPAHYSLLLIGTTNQLRYAVIPALVALFLGWQHAYDLLIVWIVPTLMAVYCLYRRAVAQLTGSRYVDSWPASCLPLFTLYYLLAGSDLEAKC